MNINQLMKQAQNMQKKMQEMQQEAASKEFEGKSGGGLVSVIMKGDGTMCKVFIDPSLLTANEQEMLEDLLVAAHNDAKIKADLESKDNLSNTFGNMPGMPGGLGM